jgi:membrane protease YdiL (CAAX protease family)
MSKTRAVLYAFGAPAMYFLLNIVVYTVFASCFSFVTIFPEISKNPGMSGPELEKIMDASIRAAIDGMIKYQMQLLFCAGALFIGIMLLAFRRRGQGLWKTVLLNRNVTPSTLALAMLAGFAAHMIFSSILSGVPEDWLGDYSELMDSMMSGNPVITFVVLGLFVPLVEEIVFRGFAQRYLEAAAGPWAAVIFQAVLFSAFHMNPVQSAYTVFAGLLMGAVYMWTRNLWAPIALHAAFNLSGYLVNGVLELIFGSPEVELSDITLAVCLAAGATLLFFCVRQFHRRFKRS